MSNNSLETLLARWQSGELKLDRLDQELRSAYAPTVDTAEVKVDMDRAQRCGFPEVVYGSGKTPEAIRDVFLAQRAAGQNSFATRVSIEQAEFVRRHLPSASFNPIARTLTQLNSQVTSIGKVIVVSAGTSDRPVAEEALETASWMGCETELIQDVGVAGPHRLISQRERLATAEAVVVVAGMEGALPSVVAGWVAVPVIGVPTSVGYGANFGGVAPLLSMLNSCAANVAVVNIDAGFKGGYLAGLIVRQTSKTVGPTSEGQR